MRKQSPGPDRQKSPISEKRDIPMTKANTKSTHESFTGVRGGIPTRRHVMNMIVRSAAAIAAVPAIAQASPHADAAAIPTAALAAMPTLDPIYAAIELHRAEQKAYADALIARDKLHEIVPKEIRRGPRVQLGRKDGQPYYLHSHEQIDRRLEWMPDFASTPEIRTRLHDEFDRDMRELWAKQDEHGMTAADDLVEQLCHSCDKLAWAIATTEPTSMAGVAAVLRYVNEFEGDGEEWPDTGEIGYESWHYQLRLTLAAALDKVG